MATDFGGSLFYEYHKLFSAKAATVLHNNGIKLDWSIRDTDLYCRLCAGRRVNACTLCSSVVAHSTGMCPLASSLKTPSAGLNKRNADGVNDAVGHQRKFHAGVVIITTLAMVVTVESASFCTCAVGANLNSTVVLSAYRGSGRPVRGLPVHLLPQRTTLQLFPNSTAGSEKIDWSTRIPIPITVWLRQI